MSRDARGERFDGLLLSEARLGIVSALITRRSETFTGLKELLGLTQGNLGLHLRKLEEGGYVTIDKAFVGRKPRSTVTLTRTGRRAFLDHVERLRRIAEGEDLLDG